MISLIFHKINSPQNISSRLENTFLLEKFFHNFPVTQHWTSCLQVNSYTWPPASHRTVTHVGNNVSLLEPPDFPFWILLTFPSGASCLSLLEPPELQYMFGDLYGPPRFPLLGPLLL